MAREFDKALCDYFRVKHGPFKVNGTVLNYKTSDFRLKCDFCNEPDSNKLTRLESEVPDRQGGRFLYVCTCGALQYLVPDEAGEVALKSLLQGVGLSKSVMGGTEPDPEAAREMLEADEVLTGLMEKKKKPEHMMDLHEIVKTVKVQMAFGHGTHWKILPDLMRQYDSRGTLSEKQRAVLVKFLASIK